MRRRTTIPPRSAAAAAAVAALVGCAGIAAAHEEILVQIAKIDERLAQGESSADLYLKRGELYRLHEEFARAFADYDQAESIDPQVEGLALERAAAFLETAEPAKALPILDKVLQGTPQHAPALTLRARGKAALGFPAEAAADLTKAIAATAEPRPDQYVERAQIQLSLPEGGPEAALAGLEEGIAHFGAAGLTLHEFALQIELDLGRQDAAAARAAKIVASQPANLRWHLRHAEILADLGRGGEAKAAAAEALERIEALPPARRRSAAMAEMEAKFRGY